MRHRVHRQGVRAAIATGKLKAKSLGAKSFTNSGGTKSIEILFGKGGSRTARQRGSVIIDVNTSGQSSSVRLRTR